MDEQELTAAVKAHALDAGLDLVGIIAVADLDTLPAIWVGWTIQAHTERIRDHLPGFPLAVVIGYHVWDNLLEAAVGKNALLVTPDFGPWIRLDLVLTDAPLIPDAAFEEDLCGDCDACVAACPVGALTPYTVDADRCLVGVHLGPGAADADTALLARFEPQITPGGHLMCTACQKVCPLGRCGL